MYPALLLTLTAAANTPQELQILHSKGKIFRIVYTYVGPSVRLNLTFLTSVSAKTRDLRIQQNTVDPLHVALSLPHLAIPVQTTSQ